MMRAAVRTAGPSTTTSSSSDKSKLAIIVVAAIGGFIFIVALVLVIVPFARRRASKRRPKHVQSSTSSDGTSTTAHSRRDAHNRVLSVDASVPLLEPDPLPSSEFVSSNIASPLVQLRACIQVVLSTPSLPRLGTRTTSVPSATATAATSARSCPHRPHADGPTSGRFADGRLAPTRPFPNSDKHRITRTSISSHKLVTHPKNVGRRGRAHSAVASRSIRWWNTCVATSEYGEYP
ncbi:hypothetical protein BGW80DRAFT_918387 [Lactifluus volemus]|nr:hypothetical protein BGW80DRAFT_918387 [Lactifluus volemus]